MTTPIAGERRARACSRRSTGRSRAPTSALLSDYQKGLLTPDACSRTSSRGGVGRASPCVVDPKGEDFARYRGATGHQAEPRADRADRRASRSGRPRTPSARPTALLARFGFDFALVTLDRDGMCPQASATATTHAFRTQPREVFDVTGAGDMVLAVLGLVLGSGATPAEAAALANVAAGLEVEKVGVVPDPARGDRGAPRRARAAPRQQGRRTARRRRRSRRRLREAGRRIVFTNGCFDVLHAGHVRYLGVRALAGRRARRRASTRTRASDALKGAAAARERASPTAPRCSSALDGRRPRRRLPRGRPARAHPRGPARRARQGRGLEGQGRRRARGRRGARGVRRPRAASRRAQHDAHPRAARGDAAGRRVRRAARLRARPPTRAGS